MVVVVGVKWSILAGHKACEEPSASLLCLSRKILLTQIILVQRIHLCSLIHFDLDSIGSMY